MLRQREKVLIYAETQPHRASGGLGQQHRERLDLAEALAAEAAADEARMHPHAVIGHFENVRNILPNQKRVLAAGPELDRFAFGAGEYHKGLHVIRRHPRERKRVLGDVVAARERRIDVAEIAVELVQEVRTRLRNTLAGFTMRTQSRNLRMFEQQRRARRHCF